MEPPNIKIQRAKASRATSRGRKRNRIVARRIFKLPTDDPIEECTPPLTTLPKETVFETKPLPKISEFDRNFVDFLINHDDSFQDSNDNNTTTAAAAVRDQVSLPPSPSQSPPLPVMAATPAVETVCTPLFSAKDSRIVPTVVTTTVAAAVATQDQQSDENSIDYLFSVSPPASRSPLPKQESQPAPNLPAPSDVINDVTHTEIKSHASSPPLPPPTTNLLDVRFGVARYNFSTKVREISEETEEYIRKCHDKINLLEKDLKDSKEELKSFEDLKRNMEEMITAIEPLSAKRKKNI